MFITLNYFQLRRLTISAQAKMAGSEIYENPASEPDEVDDNKPIGTLISDPAFGGLLVDTLNNIELSAPVGNWNLYFDSNDVSGLWMIISLHDSTPNG